MFYCSLSVCFSCEFTQRHCKPSNVERIRAAVKLALHMISQVKYAITEHYNRVQIDYNIRQDKHVYLVAVYIILVKRTSIIVCYKLSKQPTKRCVESCHQLS